MRRVLPIVAALLLAPVPSLAQERSPEMRQTLVELSRVLGESHALRQACEGSDDQYWRSRMNRLVETESADPEQEAQLKDSFNAGFAEGRRLYRGCDDGVQRAQGLTAARGRELATVLSHAQYRSGVVQPTPQDEDVTAEPAPR
ncbi:MAG: TIGR02301 family protein [Phenylobacterium sp.]|uniref:TIGR02301 family protein n=1 Tax=Phenylobacterium sp. TaxID=1871053 RepID=UPI0025E9F89F|nr:TIGR02301 family protein [Phenylobacterium sp.]MBA4012661.1 TIGR02301 family protein [Phenylobacterium sp.]